MPTNPFEIISGTKNLQMEPGTPFTKSGPETKWSIITNPEPARGARMADLQLLSITMIIRMKSNLLSRDDARIKRQEQLKLVDGVLYRRWSGKEGKPAVLQLLVLATLRHDFIIRAHTGMCGAHLGVRRALDQAQRRGFWLGWRRDVLRFCWLCPNFNSYFR